MSPQNFLKLNVIFAVNGTLQGAVGVVACSAVTMPRSLSLRLLPGSIAICRFAPDSPWPEWATSAPFAAVTRTADELSVVVTQDRVPDAVLASAAADSTGDGAVDPPRYGPRCQRDFRALVVAGTLEFELVGILSGMASPLAGAGISIFAISTHDTDYILVRQRDLERALTTLRGAGYAIE